MMSLLERALRSRAVAGAAACSVAMAFAVAGGVLARADDSAPSTLKLVGTVLGSDIGTPDDPAIAVEGAGVDSSLGLTVWQDTAGSALTMIDTKTLRVVDHATVPLFTTIHSVVD